MPWVPRWRWGLGLVGVLGAAHAQAAELDWRAAPPCPDAAEVQFRVERALGMPLTQAAPLRFTVTAERSGEGFRAHVAAESEPGAPAGDRTLAAVDCSRLADMVTMAVALALGAGLEEDAAAGDDRAAREERTRVDAPGGGGASGAGVGSERAGAERSAGTHAAPTSGARWQPAISGWLLGDTGSLPDPGPGLALGAELGGSVFRAQALGTWLLGQHRSLPAAGAPAPGADLALWAAALSGCVTPFQKGRLSPFGCIGWELGRLSGEGTGVSQPRSGAALWSAPRADVGARWALGIGGLRLAAALTLAAPLGRDDFVLSDVGSVHRPPALVARAALGLGWEP